MMRAMKVLGLAVAIGAAGACAPATTGMGGMAGSGVMPGSDLQTAMRKLWADHVIWTRAYIVAAVADDPSAQNAAARLLRNQDDIGNAIVPFYGQPAGSELARLLREHITIAVDLVTAAKAGNSTAQAAADRRWRTNAEEIATFLSGANPNWPRATLLTMLNQHLDLTTQEAVARLQRNWAADVIAFDRIFDQAMEMADALTAGIRAQFPGTSLSRMEAYGLPTGTGSGSRSSLNRRCSVRRAGTVTWYGPTGSRSSK